MAAPVLSVLLLALPARAVVLSSQPTVVVSADQVTVWWTTDVASTTELHFGPTSAPTSLSSANHSVAAVPEGPLHSRTLRGLAPGTYFFRVRSAVGTDDAESAEAQFTVTAPSGLLSNWGVNGTVNTITHKGSTYYVGGAFSQAGPNEGGGVVVDPTTGALLPDQPRVDGVVTDAISDGSGGLFIAGSFQFVGGLAREGLAHLLPSGGVDPSWNANLPSGVSVARVVRGSNGWLYLAGRGFRTTGGMPSGAVAVDATTGALTAWDPQVQDSVLTLATSGSTVYLGGTFRSIGGVTRFNAAAVDANSAALLPWDPAPGNWVYDLSVGPLSVYLAGFFITMGGQSRWMLAEVDSVTGAVSSWNTPLTGGLLGTAHSVAVAGGELYATVTTGNNAEVFFVDRVTGGFTRRVAMNSSGRVQVVGTDLYVTGDFTTVGPTPARGAFRWNARVTESAWQPQVAGTTQVVQSFATGLFVGGTLLGNAAVSRRFAAAFDATTGTTRPWDPRFNSPPSIFRLGSASVFAGGFFTQAQGLPRLKLAELNEASGAPTAWSPAVSGGGSTTVGDLALSSTSLWLVGWFDALGGQPRLGVGEVELATAGPTPWRADWGPGRGSIVAPRALVLEPDQLFVAGSFETDAGGQPRRHLAAFAFDGGVLAWNPDPNGGVSSMLRVPQGLLVGGSFSVIGDVAQPGLALLDLVDAGVRPWSSATWQSVSALAQAGPNVLVSGVRVAGGQPVMLAIDLASGTPTGWQFTGLAPSVIDIDCSTERLAVPCFRPELGGSCGGLALLSATGACAALSAIDAGVDAGGADAGGVDAGGVDAGGVDAGGVDAGGVDAGGADAGGVDAGGVDAGGVDAGGVDAGGVDAGGVDAGGVDAGGVDAGAEDGGAAVAQVFTVGCGCNQLNTSAQGVLVLLGWVVAIERRRRRHR